MGFWERFSRGCEDIFNYRSPLPFFLGAVVAIALQDVISRGMDLILGEFAMQELLVTAVILLTVLILLAVGIAMYQENRMKSGRLTIKAAEDAPEKKGLICLVSNPDTVMRAVEYHKPAYLWLVTSEAMIDTANKIEDRINKDGTLAKVEIVREMLSDDEVFTHDKTEEIVNNIFQNLPAEVSETDVIADFTGGTKTMTVGMLLACLNESRALEYVPNKRIKGGFQMGNPIYIHAVRE